MAYILGIAAIGILGFIAYLLFFRRSGDSPSSNDNVPKEISRRPRRDNVQLMAEWEGPLHRALNHIYAGTASTTARQMQTAFAKPSEAAATNLLKMTQAFERIGSLHGSLSAVDSPRISMRELGDIVTLDPVLSARVLKSVNSPLFYLANEVKSVHTAVIILGLNNLKNLISLGALPYNLYTTANKQRIFKKIWRHMNNTAITASHMAKSRQDMDSSSMYTAGLMHDIGKLVLALMLRDTEYDYPRTVQEEYELLSATHLHAGELIAKNGFFPEQLRFLVRSHHLPAVLPVSQIQCNAEQAKQLTTLFLANQIAKLITQDGGLHEHVEGLDQLEPSYQEIISKEEAQAILLSPGLINDILKNTWLVRGILN